MSKGFTESAVEDATFGWLQALGYAVKHVSEIAASEPTAECCDPDYRETVVKQRLHGALWRNVACRDSQVRRRPENCAERAT
jgi:hypothetical protein